MSWQRTTLGEVATIVMGQSPPGSTYNEVGQGLPFYQGVKDFGSRYPTKRAYCTAPTRIAEEGDILFSVRAPIGSINRANEKCSIGRGLSVVRAHSGDDFDFIEYLLKSMNRAWGAYESQGAIFGNARRRDLEDLQIAWPPHSARVQIAAILSAYDDLIENNRRRIQLLEQAARLLYKEWFVHLRFPGHEHVAITDGVPEGWGEGVVADFYSTGSGGTPSRKNPDFYTGEIPWVKTQELTGGFILSTGERITNEAVKRSAAKLFPQHTVLIAMYGATIGQTAILSVPSTTNQACCAVIPKKHGTSYVHAYLFFCHHKTDLVGLGQGAAQNNVSQQVIKSFKMVLPRKKLLEAFSERVSPLFDQIEILQKNNINLTKARDLLLPRLMNGEVVV